MATRRAKKPAKAKATKKKPANKTTPAKKTKPAKKATPAKKPAPKAKPAAKSTKSAATPFKHVLSPLQADLAKMFSDADDWDLELFDDLEVDDDKRADRRAAGLVTISDETVVIGDFVIDGDLEVNNLLVVTGSLRCTGFVFSGIHSRLVVGGDLTARAVESWQSYWLVGGSIACETAWLSTMGFLMLGGELRTRLLVVQMHFDLVDDPVVHAAARIDTDFLPKDPAARARLDEILVTTDLADKDGQFDSWALLRKVSRGEPVFRAGASG